MATYSLIISMNPEDVQKVTWAGQTITVVREVSAYVAGSNWRYMAPKAVAWLALPPASQTTLSWDDQFEAYATTSDPMLNQPIRPNARIIVQPGRSYRFAQGYFQEQEALVDQDVRYILINDTLDSQQHLRFGLAQRYTLNYNCPDEAIPLNAVPVLFNQQARLDPETALAVFLSSAPANGSEIPPAPSSSLFTIGPNQRVTLGFNGATNTFYLRQVQV